jgi:hypothetical protein
MIRFRAWGERARHLIDPLLLELQTLPLGQPPEIIWQGGGLDEQSKNSLDELMITEPPAPATPQVLVSYAWGNTHPAPRKKIANVRKWSNVCARRWKKTTGR